MSGVLAALCLLALVSPLAAEDLPASALTLHYNATGGKQPSDIPDLGYVCFQTGTADFPNGDKPPLRTRDADPQGDGRYYFRPFTRRDLGAGSDISLQARLRVLASSEPALSTCLQLSLRDKRVGIGFLTHEPGPGDDEVLLLDLGATGHGEVLSRATLPLDTMRAYVLRTERSPAGPDEDALVFETEGLPDQPVRIRIADLKTGATGNFYGLTFGHPVGMGTGEAEWERVTMTITRAPRVEGPADIGRRRQLFLDDRLVRSSQNLHRVQGEPVKRPDNPTLRRAHPWEAARCELYGSAVWDPLRRRIQLFYSAMSKPYEIRMAYAESDDLGATWRRPLSDLFPFEGRPTNIVYPGRYTPHGPSVVLDPRDPDPARRYKLFTADYPIPLTEEAQTKGRAGIDVAFSADGIHWTPSPRNPVLPDFISDTGQCVLWDAGLGKWVAFVRSWQGGQRSVARTESADFETWTTPEVVYSPTAADRERGWQFYSLSATHYQGLYVGLVWIFPAVPESGDWNSAAPTTWPELVVSPDGIEWERVAFGKPFLPNGPAGSFDARQIRTASSLVVTDDRILLVYAGSPHPHVSAHNFDIGVASLRLDGFCAMQAGEAEGTLLTVPLTTPGGELRINARTAAGGSVTAEVCDASGQTLPGFEAQSCAPFQGDATDARLIWATAARIPASPDKGLSLRFHLRKADLYSFTIAEGW